MKAKNTFGILLIAAVLAMVCFAGAGAADGEFEAYNMAGAMIDTAQNSYEAAVALDSCVLVKVTGEVTLPGDFIVTKNTKIVANKKVTLASGKKFVVEEGVALTVDGTLEDDATTAVTHEVKGRLVVNGTLGIKNDNSKVVTTGNGYIQLSGESTADILSHVEGWVIFTGNHDVGWEIITLGGKQIVGATPIVTYSLDLKAGWNFISIPMYLDSSMETAAVFFEGIDMDNNSVFGWDGKTQSWKQITGTTILTPLEGYWVYSKVEYPLKPIIFNTNGLSVGTTKPIYKGWNAVGLSIDISGGNNKMSAKSAFAGLDWNRYFEKWTTGTWRTIVNGGSTADNEENYLYAGAGGWLYANADGTLVGNAT